MELFLYPLIFRRLCRRRSFSERYRGRLRKGCHTLARFADEEGSVPQIGDMDNGRVLCFSGERTIDVQRILSLGGAVLDEPELINDTYEPELEFWNLDDRGKGRTGTSRSADGEALAVRRGDAQTFLTDRERNWKLIFLHGPLGYKRLAAHGHADALSVLLYAGGQPILIDPGTYTYHGDRTWRDYFRGTRAHNTLSIAGENQARIGGRFLWTHHYHCRFINGRNTDHSAYCSAQLSGYRHCSFVARHRRSLRVRAHSVHLVDVVGIDRSESFARHFHLHPDVELRRTSEKRFVVKQSGRSIGMCFPENGEVSVHNGEQDPPLGWYSPSFEQKKPCPVIRHSGELHEGINRLPVRISL